MLTFSAGPSTRTLKLCHTPPYQFDPIYSADTISTAGFVQSILYELLYVEIFGMEDAMEAADFMLNGIFEEGKPETLSLKFNESGLEALENNLIPFPYKVAKCLDPTCYRNIEYDVWSVEKQDHFVKRFHRNSDHKPTESGESMTIGKVIH